MGKKIAIGFGLVLFMIVIAFFGMNKEPDLERDQVVSQSGSQDIVRPEVRREIPEPPADVANTYQLSGTLPPLDNSDEKLFAHLSLLLNSLSLSLLNDEQFIRKLVLQIDNAAKGTLIYQHTPLAAPLGYMNTIEESGTIYLDPESYIRYNPYGRLVESVDTGLLVAYYRFYEPLLDEAYAELGYAEGSFRGTFIKAIDQALSTPVIEGQIELVQPEANYIYADESLEGLNMVQKQLLRMGPENTAKIQTALQRFKARIQ